MDEILEQHRQRVARLNESFRRLLELHGRLSETRAESWYVVSRQDPGLQAKVDELQRAKARLEQQIARLRAETFPPLPARAPAAEPAGVAAATDAQSETDEPPVAPPDAEAPDPAAS